MADVYSLWRSHGRIAVLSLLVSMTLLVFLVHNDISLTRSGPIALIKPISRRMQNYGGEDLTGTGTGVKDAYAEEVLGTDEWQEDVETETKAAIKQQREKNRIEMQDYEFHPKLNVRSVDELTPETGGKPVMSVVLTSWRSGSTFLGDLLQSHPATYYHYEPLLDFGITQVRGGELGEKAIMNLKALLRCNYTNLESYLDYGTTHQYLFLHNERLWTLCGQYPDLCWDPTFLSGVCKTFPFQSMKTVRLRLKLAQPLLEDRSLRTQVLLLVRDPRGTIQSRHHRDWCPGNPDCSDPARLCKDLVSDYETAKIFKRKYPNSFRVVRYEDLSFDPYNKTKELFEFFHLHYHPQVQEFLKTHTQQTIGGVSSTFRDSKTAPVHWRKDLAWSEVKAIQKVCTKALNHWGYDIATSEKHLRTFMPVLDFVF